MSNFDAILCRTNGAVISTAIEEAATGAKVCVRITGGFGSIKGWYYSAKKLMNNEPCEHPHLGQYNNWDEVLKSIEDKETEPEVVSMVKLIERSGLGILYRMIETCIDGEDKKRQTEASMADVTIVTAHKAKGLEFDRVLIHSDFGPKGEPDENGRYAMPSPDELRLAYVAVTRARLHLDATALAWVAEAVPA